MADLGENASAPNDNSPVLVETPIMEVPTPISNATPTPISNTVEEHCYDAKKLTSIVWEHFKKEKINGEWKAICNYCKRKLGGDSKNGTSHLRDHMARCNKRLNKDIRQQLLVANQKKMDGKVLLKNFAFDQSVARKELAYMVIMHEYPLSMVDHTQFRKYSASLQPLFNVPSRNTIKSDILKVFKEEKAKTISMLEVNEGRIAITTDMWTADHQKRGYMVVTAHYIDNYWSLQKRIIRFEYVPTPHTKDVIASTLMKCFVNWNIDRKLSSITVDNCTVNDGVVDLLVDRLGGDALLLHGEFFHMRCCAHILHLIVKDGLSVIELAIERIRDSVLFWNATPKRWEKFEEAARQLRIPTSKKLSIDVKTRWNSTYMMLETAIFYKDVFPRCVQLHRDSLYKCLPTEDDWIMAKEICEKLKLFYDITESFSGTKYATANLYFPNVCKIKLALREWIVRGSETIARMAVSMSEKFDKYWAVVHGIMGVATILDPRYKTSLLEYYFEKIYGENSEAEIERIVRLCRDLLREYQKKMAMEKEMGNVSSSLNTSSFLVDSIVCELEDYDDFVTRKRSKKAKVISELDRYLEEDVIKRVPDFDILNWWKTTGPQYPTLQAIVKDVYAIPVSTVASESSFSTGGRLVSAQRNKLHPSTIEALTCSQNWLWAEQGSISREQALFGEDIDEIEVEEDVNQVRPME